MSLGSLRKCGLVEKIHNFEMKEITWPQTSDAELRTKNKDVRKAFNIDIYLLKHFLKHFAVR